MTATATLAPIRVDKDERLLVRRARFEDMDQVADFVRSSAEWYRPLVSEEDMSEHEVPDEWAAKNFAIREFYLGFVGGEPFGTISMQDFGGWCYLGYIYLDTEFCGRGLGQTLMRFAERCARRRGMKGLCLIAHPEATWATRAYEKFGFDKVASERDDVLAWEDGALAPFYEQDFELYLYPFEAGVASL